jgi:hypothetical protein
MRFIIDSAAEVNIFWNNFTSRKLLPSKYKIYGLGNNAVKTYGCANIKLNINNTIFNTEFHIVKHDNFQYDGLLGISFLRQNKAVINVGDNTITIQGRKYPLRYATTGMREKYVQETQAGPYTLPASTHPPPTYLLLIIHLSNYIILSQYPQGAQE